MKNKTVFCVIFICGLFFNSYSYAKSPVWKVSKDGHHLFIGGTIHLLTKADYPLPSAFDTAYNNSELLVLEADLEKLKTPELQQEVIKKIMYSGGQDISQHLKPETMKALQDHLASRGVPKESLNKLKPGMLSVTLTLIELQRLGLVGSGVDEFYSLKALNENRKIEHLETAIDQLDFLSTMGEGSENELIEHTLSDLESMPTLLNTIKNAWKEGDISELKRVASDPMKDRFPKIYDSLLVKRNNHWLPKIEKMVETEEVELVLFGALHLVGESGILSQLKAHGYKIENQ